MSTTTKLSLDIQYEIIRRLPISKRLKCQTACRSWYNFVRSPSCWTSETLTFKIWTVPSEIYFTLANNWATTPDYVHVGTEWIKTRDFVCISHDLFKPENNNQDDLRLMLYYAQFARHVNIECSYVHKKAIDYVLEMLKKVEWRCNTLAFEYNCEDDEEDDEEDDDYEFFSFNDQRDQKFTHMGFLKMLMDSRLKTIDKYPMSKCIIQISGIIKRHSIEDHITVLKQMCQMRADYASIDYWGWSEYNNKSNFTEHIDDVNDQLIENGLRGHMLYKLSLKDLNWDFRRLTITLKKCQEPPYSMIFEEKQCKSPYEIMYDTDYDSDNVSYCSSDDDTEDEDDTDSIDNDIENYIENDLENDLNVIQLADDSEVNKLADG